jgi:hypothetical protein
MDIEQGSKPDPLFAGLMLPGSAILLGLTSAGHCSFGTIQAC